MIVAAQDSDNEEDDQFVVDAAPQLPEASELEMVSERARLLLSLPAAVLERPLQHLGYVDKTFLRFFSQISAFFNFVIALRRTMEAAFRESAFSSLLSCPGAHSRRGGRGEAR